jgi:KUP system potassium uptake protein
VLLGSNLLKFFIGGWVPVLIAVFVFTLMMTWKKGRVQLQEKLQSDTLQLETFIKYLGTDMNKVSGIAVFLTGSPSVVPHALLHNLKHNKILHDKNMLVTVQVSDIPYVQDELRYEFEVLEKGFYRIQINYGFKEQPNVPMVLEQIFNKIDFEYNLMEISFFVSRERLIYKADNKLTTWRKQLFATMQKNTSPISDFYQIPTNRVVEIGSQIEI